MPVAIAPNAIPPAYAKFGVTRGFHPKPFNRLNWLIKSRGGWGKSTFLSSIPGCLHLDLEGGAHSVVNSEAVRVPDHTHGMTLELVRGVFSQLITDGQNAKGDSSKLPFQVIAFDTIDAYYNLLASEFCAGKNPAGKTIECVQEYGSNGAGYGNIYAQLLNDLTALESLGYATVLACHERDKEITVTENGKYVTTTVTRSTLGDSLAKALENRVDMAAVIRPTTTVVTPTKFIDVGGTKKEVPDNSNKQTVKGFVMQVECSAQYDAKHRVPL
jgi:hypothetical protein